MSKIQMGFISVASGVDARATLANGLAVGKAVTVRLPAMPAKEKKKLKRKCGA